MAVIVLGDLAEAKLDPGGAERAREAFDAVLNIGAQLAFIVGNHDAGTDELWRLVEDYDEFRIDGRVLEIDGIRTAGLGGVVRGRIWYGEGKPRVSTEAELIAATPRQERWKGGIPKAHRTTLMPWTVEELRSQTTDLLVTHEAPLPHQYGFEFINRLAADMGAQLVVHGHHHRTYSDVTKDGISIQGVGLAHVWRLEIEM
ncbi:hypothetical protein OCH239_09655 [Roseivivax halodurans JCM 10272]|uniref:Calcineurin-like phosphoesterase domain-containing protein n=2 Tax=Roseivivax halodurans TaxID=93683 RepID=X7EBS4_9RHOB|nr:hypothetical protein OCH239_09655 [Roseivivax halodurans JCM 10272]